MDRYPVIVTWVWEYFTRELHFVYLPSTVMCFDFGDKKVNTDFVL